MPRPKKSEAEKLNELQKAAVLWVGGCQLKEEEQPAKFAYSMYESYYSEKPTVVLYADVAVPTKGTDKKWNGKYTSVSIRTNTFRALDRRGLATVTEKKNDPIKKKSNARYYVTLTLAGWNVFQELAEKKQTEIDAYAVNLKAAVQQAEKESQYFVIEVVETRTRVIEEVRKRQYKVVAADLDAAQAKAQESHNNNDSYYSYWRKEGEETTTDPVVGYKATDTGDVTIGIVAQREYIEQNPRPASFVGMELFTKDGKRPTCMIPKTTVNMVRFTDVMQDLDGDEDEKESAPTVNMDRFAFMRDES